MLEDPLRILLTKNYPLHEEFQQKNETGMVNNKIKTRDDSDASFVLR
jgi:hypothetical protein